MTQIKRKIMLVVGEASGDSHAGKLVTALRDSTSDFEIEFFGATGPKMRAAGVETVIEADQFGIMGLTEVARALPMFWGVFKTLKREARDRKPDIAVLVDFPEFNLKLAKALKKQGITVVYYVSPQLWAWRQYRAKAIDKYVDLLLTILPFEKDWYAKKGIRRVEYVGNPLAGEVKSAISREEFCKRHGLNDARPVIALLAGSRRKEKSRILPVLVETASQMSARDPEIQFVNALASTRRLEEVDEVLESLKQNGIKKPENFVTVRDETYEALNAADVAAITSGTATLESAIIGTPFVMVYATSALNWKIFRPLISVEHYSLVNLIAQREIAKELMQNDLDVSSLSEELFQLLKPKRNREMRERLKEIKEMLGKGGASNRAAEAILRLINSD